MSGHLVSGCPCEHDGPVPYTERRATTRLIAYPSSHRGSLVGPAAVHQGAPEDAWVRGNALAAAFAVREMWLAPDELHGAVEDPCAFGHTAAPEGSGTGGEPVVELTVRFEQFWEGDCLTCGTGRCRHAVALLLAALGYVGGSSFAVPKPDELTPHR